ncbi:LacI family DNA-binding transcriptional regulator [Paenibacillus nasutitermitis]|uniref:LacI family transcriptional regulator n=1 Tax=Paenibacillus nasutitermitis TaxID=1652958 RepID=A0A916YUX6_9BACL|nr:LacI family DNA-binding transcriptional regulator [Paenibacillus nasutitermitis]GGD62927.1 LacI family transcriptional regulator [Paenibacillus nasutitermitis]
MSITIKDIASIAGVSHVTVLRVLNGKPNVKPQTREKILAIAREHNYVTNRLARNLSGKQSNVIGLIITDISNPLYAELVRGADDVFSKHNYRTIIHNSDNQKVLASKGLINMKELRVAGLLVAVPSKGESDFLKELEQIDLPYVCFSTNKSNDNDYVAFDDEKGGYILGKHLVELGHRRIVCLAPEERNTRPTQARLEGLQRALRECGIPFSEADIFEIGFGYQDGYRMADRILQIPGVTATVCLYDKLAIGLLRRLKERGISVPDDMAVSGFDDNEISTFLETSLTSVSLPKYTLGQKGGQLLLDKLNYLAESPWVSQQMMIEPVLMIRESTKRM